MGHGRVCQPWDRAGSVDDLVQVLREAVRPADGLYVKTGEFCNGENRYECSNCIFARSVRHLWLKEEHRDYMCGHCYGNPTHIVLTSWVINEDNAGCMSPYYCLESYCGTDLFCSKWKEAFLNETNSEVNYNVTVKCVDEDLCGPGYRNAMRRAWSWLSWQASRHLCNLWGLGFNAYLMIWIIFYLHLVVEFVRRVLLPVITTVFEARHDILQYVGDLYDRFFNVREVARLRAALAAEGARADHLAVELATLRGMNHMCTALAHRVGAYNDDDG